VARQAGVERIVYVSAYGARPDHPIDFFRTKHAVEQALAESGVAHAILRPTAFMEHPVHLFNGKSVLDKGKAPAGRRGQQAPQLRVRRRRRTDRGAGAARRPGTVRSARHRRPPATTAMPKSRRCTRARRASRRAPRICRPRSCARCPCWSRRFHPGAARIMRLLALPDDAFSERFDGAADLERRFALELTTVEDFVAARVAEAGAAGR
jgi:hypothetical protein